VVEVKEPIGKWGSIVFSLRLFRRTRFRERCQSGRRFESLQRWLFETVTLTE